ncbi:MAG: TonB family protein [Flavobacteriales bacterium]|nr:TonB family protein [Flavobacteriales bacterium]MBK7083396.1 TonB family protein [Flavobacteriales bacterium]MBK7751716.1 TonB family protein [Flavobacteriales bacterium]MBK9076452.1 TonB family protein [Flavobacteriales bacterium]MBK9539510.1 TonB family protein [Flavobacteriales bacterium]
MKRHLIPALVVIVFTVLVTEPTAAGQNPEPVYLNGQLEVTTKGKASYYRVQEGVEGAFYLGRTYSVKKKLLSEGHYADPQLRVPHGRFTFYHPNGKVESTGDFAEGLKSGVWQRYDQWGRELAEKVYDPDALASILYTRAETMPRYPGGEKALVKYVRSKVTTGDNRVKGEVITSVTVEKDGNLSEVKVLEGESELLDQRVVDALRGSSPWSPGMDRGRPVRVQMRVPIDF